MNNIKRNLLVALSLVATLAAGAKDNTPTLKETVGKYFYIGAAVNTAVVWERNTMEANIVKDNFKKKDPGHCMKRAKHRVGTSTPYRGATMDHEGGLCQKKPL